MHQKRIIKLVLTSILLSTALITGFFYYKGFLKKALFNEKESTKNEERHEKEESGNGVGEPVSDHGVSSPAEPSPTPEPQMIYVFICGAVENEDVYLLTEGTRLYSLVNLAGGFLKEADTGFHNLARVLTNGERIYIPTKEETEGKTLEERLAGEPGAGTSEGKKEDGIKTVNINTAGIEELMALPGIGEQRARTIIAYREKVGRFEKPEDIMNVSGIGEAMFARFSDMITVE